MSLALATVIYEWRRYLAAVVALAFSGLLVLAQVGMFVGIGKAFTATIDRSRGDLMILPAKSESLLNTGGLPRRVMPLIYSHPEVVAVSDIDDDGGMFSNLAGDESHGRKKVRDYVQITAVETARDALTLPTDFDEDLRETLSEPYAVAVDRTALARLGVKLGDKAAIDGHAVKIAAITTTYPNMMQPQVMVSRQTLRLLGKSRPGNRIGPMFVRLRDPSRATIVRDQLNAMAAGRFRAWTKPELSKANDQSMMKEQFIGVMLGFSMFLGLLIGIGITSQTLRGAILANVKEFASLRALGVSIGSLNWVVLELSFWVGVAGLLATAVLVAGVAMLAQGGGIPMSFPLTNVISTGVFLLVIAMLSGLMSLGVLKKSQPADLLR
jgi:putative ABC transport system permease protein